MRHILSTRVIVAICTAALGASALLPLGAESGAVVPPQGHVGHNQVFAASVNGSTGVVAPAVIRMGCFGPLVPGQTGHPLAGQSVEVFRPEVIVADLGFTGPVSTHIQAFFGPPPPSPVAPAAGPAGSNVVFTRYGVRQAVPTTVTLPCAGSGNVYFVPLPWTPIGPARDAVVRVTYVGQP